MVTGTSVITAHAARRDRRRQRSRPSSGSAPSDPRSRPRRDARACWSPRRIVTVVVGAGRSRRWSSCCCFLARLGPAEQSATATSTLERRRTTAEPALIGVVLFAAIVVAARLRARAAHPQLAGRRGRARSCGRWSPRHHRWTARRRGRRPSAEVAAVPGRRSAVRQPGSARATRTCSAGVAGGLYFFAAVAGGGRAWSAWLVTNRRDA